MKFADRLKFTATGTSAATITVGAAVTACRTLAQAIADGALSVSDTGVPFTVTDGTNWEDSLFTVTSSTVLTRTSVLASSAGGTTPATFSGALTVFNATPGSYLTGQTVNALTDATLASGMYLLVTDASGNAFRASLSALQSFLGTTGTPAATVTSVSVSPTTASLSGGGSTTFTATVTGTNSPAQTVTWSANGGTITTGGVYTAPAATGSAQTITVTATSTVDNTKSGTATVTVAANTSTVTGVTVSPTSPTVNGGTGTQQFTATVAGTNSPSQAVTWAVSGGGSITTGGLFTAPLATGSAQSVTVTATSTQNASFSGSTTITIPAQTIAVTTPSSSPTVGTAYTLSGTYTGPAPTALDYQTTDNAGTPGAWVAATSPTISGGMWSFSITPTTSSTSRTVTVRDHVNTGVTGTSGAYVVNAAPAATTASQYILRADNTGSATVIPAAGSANAFSGTGSPDEHWTFTRVRVNIKTSGNAAYTGTAPVFVFGKLKNGVSYQPGVDLCPIATYAAGSLPAGSVNGNAQVQPNAAMPTSRLGGWSVPADSTYGTYEVPGGTYAYGSAASGLYILWALYPDNSAAPVDNGTGTPPYWYLNA